MLGLFRSDRVERELSEELESHLQMHIEDNLRSGMSPIEARRQAVLALGGIDQTKERYRDRRGLPRLENLIRDVRYGVRRLRSTPGFSLAAIVMVALGVGVNTMMFSQLYAIILRPLPYEHPDRLVTIGTTTSGAPLGPGVPPPVGALSVPDYEFLLGANRSFSEMAVNTQRDFNVSAPGAEPQQVTGTTASASFLSIFRVKPILGRTFTEREEREGADRVVVMSHRLWRQAFGGDPSIINRQISLNQIPYTVVGVVGPESMPFDGLVRDPADLWLPLVFTPEQRADRSIRPAFLLARLREGVAFEQARGDLDRIAATLARDYPATNAHSTFAMLRLQDAVFGGDAPITIMLQGAVLFVLLIACVNIANLLLARGVLRTPEIGIRLSLGASRGRIISQLLTENVVLFLAGGVLAVGVAFYGNDLFRSQIPFPIPELVNVDLNRYVLIFTLAISIAGGVLSGLLPAALVAARGVSESLKDGARAAALTGRRRRLSSLLVGAEIAFAVVLLTGAGLMVRSLALLQNADPGFTAENLLTVQVNLPATRYTTPDQMRAFVRDVSANVARVPGAAGVAWTTSAPMNVGAPSRDLSIEGRVPDDLQVPHARSYVTSPEYLEVLGVPLRAGRWLDERDGADAQPVVLINETMARTYWPNESPIGRRIRRGTDASTQQPWMTIVGIAGDIRQAGMSLRPEAQMFVPYAQLPRPTLFLVARMTADPTNAIGPLKEAIWSVDAQLPATNVRTMTDAIELDVWPQRAIAATLSIFSLLALLLAGIGTFAVVSYLAAQRTHEIGIRMTFGATAGAILGLLCRQLALPVGAGLVVGTMLAIGLSGAIRDLLYGVTRFDPLTLGGVLALLLACSALAVYLPARRAANLDPMLALRHE